MKKILLSLAIALVTALGFSGLISNSTYAKVRCPDGSQKDTLDQCYTGVDIAGKDQIDLNGILGTIINVIIGVVGFIAVVMMILGGINFITSQGDTAKVTKAKNTILYGVVGLIVAMLAFAIVNFVLSNVFTSK